jgi:hypothetical protein
MSDHTSFGLYKSLVPAPLFFDFIILFSSWLYTVLIILIFLLAQSLVILQCRFPQVTFPFPHFSHFCSDTYRSKHSMTFCTFRTLQKNAQMS